MGLKCNRHRIEVSRKWHYRPKTLPTLYYSLSREAIWADNATVAVQQLGGLAQEIFATRLQAGRRIFADRN